MHAKLKRGFILFSGVTIVYFIVFLLSVISGSISENLDFTSWVYYIVASLGHATLFSAILFLIFYVPLMFCFKKTTIPAVVFSVVAVIVQFILILDSYVFDIYKFHINGFVLEMVFGGGAGDIFVFDTSLYFKFFAIIFFSAVLPIIIIYYLSRIKSDKVRTKPSIQICIFLIVCIIISHLGYAVARATNNSSVQKSATVLPLFFPLTANSLLKKIGIIDKTATDFQVYNQISSDIVYPLKPLVVSDSIPKYNIVYIVIDSWNLATCDSIITPNTYRFSEKGQLFTNHYSSNFATRGGIFGLFFGLSFTYEDEFNISKMSPLIIDRLIDLNYDINVFPSANFTNPPFNEIVYRRVPDITLNTEGENSFERDTKITENFSNYLDEKDKSKPFFSFLFYDLAHAITLPSDYPKKFESTWNSPNYLALNNKMDPTPFFNLYKSCLHRTDELIGSLLEKIEAQGLLDNTIIVITGDHGQEFNENKKNYWGHGSNYSKWQVQVPFLIYYPSIEGGKVFNHMTTHYDVSPTILSRFFGVNNDSEDYSMGYDLWNDTSRYPHLVGDHVKYGFILEDMILTTGHIGSLEATDGNLNPISRNLIDVKSIQKAIEKKNRFYK